jgi:hypothetical protein
MCSDRPGGSGSASAPARRLASDAGVKRFSMNQGGATTVQGTPRPRRCASTRCFVSNAGTPVPRSALATEE